MGESHQMADGPIPFTLSGDVRSWDPETRVLVMGLIRLHVASGVPVEAVGVDRSITVIGFVSKQETGPWTVTEIRHRSGF